jgi:hypothetical protein
MRACIFFAILFIAACAGNTGARGRFTQNTEKQDVPLDVAYAPFLTAFGCLHRVIHPSTISSELQS